MHRAITAAKVVENVGMALTMQSNGIQMVSTSPSTTEFILMISQIATECLHSLFNRPFFEDDDFVQIVGPMYHGNTVSLLSNIFNWRQIDANDIDEERYVFLKKFSEV